jgi:hypothetical protein
MIVEISTTSGVTHVDTSKICAMTHVVATERDYVGIDIHMDNGTIFTTLSNLEKVAELYSAWGVEFNVEAVIQ